ncbi:MAG TPA: hypothetical protein VGQ31_09170 [Candidatus Limnocylindrales bacterium]|jgi:hypothetical protein|nr:hypothetical protein [Candidatus Limnocylindrales bacterium]
MDTRVTRPIPNPEASAEADGAFTVRATEVVGRVDHWGFVAHPDLPDGPGPAFLLVALRPSPTLRHYDPEAIDYWVAKGGRGQRRTLTHTTRMPLSEDYSWGPIRLVDRLGVSNEYLTFGGRLDAASIDDVVVVAFSSPAPLLRRGGHSQGWDAGADAIGGFFARMMVAIDFEPGFEASFAEAGPMTRYAAFVRDSLQRLAVATLGPVDDDLRRLLRHEATRLKTSCAAEWAAAGALLESASACRPSTRA